MNIQILSNASNKVGKTNYSNEFTMSVINPIDAENTDKYIKVLNVTYPLTTKNITNDKCFFFLKIGYYNFKSDTMVAPDAFDPDTDDITTIIIHSKVFTVPQGIYQMQDLVDFFNSKCSEYDVTMEILPNGHVRINCGFTLRYKFVQTLDPGTGKAFNGESLNIYNYGDLDTNGNILGGMKIEVFFSHKLHYMLGEFKDSKEVFIDQLDTTVYGMMFYSGNDDDKAKKILTRDKLTDFAIANRLPDPFDGVNRIFVLCEQVEKTLVGNAMVPLLTVIPLQYKDQGSVELVSNTPSPIARKFLKKKIEQFDIKLVDNKGELIEFDSGSVNIECVIY